MRRVFPCLLIALLCLWPQMAGARDAKMAIAYPAQYPPAQGAQLFADRLSEKGVLKLTLYPSGALGPPAQLSALAQQGTVDFALVPTPFLVPLNPAFAVFSLPFAFPDYGYAVRFQESEEGKAMLRSLERAGLKGLDYWSVGMTQLFTNQPVRQASDLKGLKIVTGGSSLAAGVMQAFGASSVTIAAGEIYSALQSGVIDASENTAAFAEAAKLSSIRKYVNITNQQYQGAVLVANQKFWDSLSSDERTQIMVIADEVTRRVDDLVVEQSAKLGSGLETVIPTSEAFKAWRATAAEVWSKNGGDPKILMVADTGGGGDTCGPGVCRCPNRSCSKDCCRRPAK